METGIPFDHQKFRTTFGVKTKAFFAIMAGHQPGADLSIADLIVDSLEELNSNASLLDELHT